MSTPNPVAFTPLVKGFNWTPSTAAINGPMPAGEVPSGFTIGIRADGDATHAAGNYANLVVVPPNQTSETPAQITAALTKALPPGNYWAAVNQTDTLNSVTSVSGWTAEVAFSIPAPIAQPLSPTGFTVS